MSQIHNYSYSGDQNKQRGDFLSGPKPFRKDNRAVLNLTQPDAFQIRHVYTGNLEQPETPRKKSQSLTLTLSQS